MCLPHVPMDRFSHFYKDISYIGLGPTEQPRVNLAHYICNGPASLMAQMVRNPPAGDPGLISGSGRSSREGNDNPLWYSCLENPMDRAAWWATVHGVAKSLA